MTKISIVKSNGKYKGFECLGHSGYAEAGEDIVCAAVSSLTINTINSIEQFTDDGFDLEADENTGSIKMYFKDIPSDDSTLLMKSMELGLNAIADQYDGQFVTVKIQEV